MLTLGNTKYRFATFASTTSAWHQDGFVNKTTIMYNLVSIFKPLEILAHFERIKIVFIKQTTITYNLVRIYTLLEIRAHFECIKMVFIKQMTTT